MNRRTAIRNALVFSAGTVLLPSCLQKDNTPVIPLKNIAVNGNQQKMLALLCETIIPTTNFMGATEVQAHGFMLMMIDECYPPEKQKIFTGGLSWFEKTVKDKYGKSFEDCTTQQKNDWLNALENKNDIPDNVLQFYQTVKQFTLQAFTSSKKYMVDVRKFNMVPGPVFKGCVPVKNKVA